jgi:hypothetical protein
MGKEKLALFWGIFMMLFYVLMAFLLIFSDVFDIKPIFRIIIGISFFIYGIFRGYRLWKDFQF